MAQHPAAGPVGAVSSRGLSTIRVRVGVGEVVGLHRALFPVQVAPLVPPVIRVAAVPALSPDLPDTVAVGQSTNRAPVQAEMSG